MIPRVYDDLDNILREGKVIVIYGPRRVGKSTLVGNYLKETHLKYKLDSGDDLVVAGILSSQSFDKINKFAAGYDLIIVDEAQRIPKVGLGLKILVDNNPKLKVLITGSSSLSLSYKIGEPLVGRMFDYILYPVSQFEFKKNMTPFELEQKKEDFLVFGSYPEVIEAKIREEKAKILTGIANSYLLRDIIELEKVGDSRILFDLLKLIAFQVGSEVSLTELGSNLGIDKKTVTRYLWLFEQSFVLYNLRGYSRNLRKEISKKSKYYFCDNGIRNAVINNFNNLSTRNDVGALWENFLVIERLKKQEYAHIGSKYNNYFWRTWDKKEIDWVEMRDGKLFGYEFKWGGKKPSKSKDAWLETYKNEAEFETINQENYLEFIT
ncbi:MAG: ATP-binding protein [Candidatus Levybacteria bacterium]|nr:ATP-binding protein [Candidatus Levybacteria bacterium]